MGVPAELGCGQRSAGQRRGGERRACARRHAAQLVSGAVADATRRREPSRESVARKRELGRGERVLPGIWRLRLPLPWPGVPHCNAWAVACDGGFVLFDSGMNEPDSLEQLERALAMCNGLPQW